MPKPAKEVASALEKKGFQLRNSHHEFYHFYVDGKKTIISTKISNGEKEIGDRLLGLMARQVKLTRRQFTDLIECPLSYEEYCNILSKAGVIQKASDPKDTTGDCKNTHEDS